MLIAELIGARAELQMAWMTGAGAAGRDRTRLLEAEGGRPGLLAQGSMVRDDQPL